MKKTLALTASVLQSWSYTNPIENQTTEVVTNLWLVSPDDLEVGMLTQGNVLVVTNGGPVISNAGALGSYGSSSNNEVWVEGEGSVWWIWGRYSRFQAKILNHEPLVALPGDAADADGFDASGDLGPRGAKLEAAGFPERFAVAREFKVAFHKNVLRGVGLSGNHFEMTAGDGFLENDRQLIALLGFASDP